MLSDYMLYSVKNITKRKLRSWLTMIGIFIGIAAVVALISLGQGLQKAVEDQFQELGADKIIIQPKGSAFSGPGSEANFFSQSNIDKIKTVNNVRNAVGMMYTAAQVDFKEEQKYFFIVGVSPDIEAREIVQQLSTFKIESGRDLKKDEKGKVVLGYNYKYGDIFTRNLRLGDKILVNENEFEVVGFAEKIGSSVDDSMLYIAESSLEEIFDKHDEYNYIYAQIEPAVNPASMVDAIERSLRKSRDVKEGEEDFEVQTFDEVLDSFFVVFNIIQAVVIGIAGISLIVGGVGIMNTMYTAVLERTKEIGVMKAIGARNSDIMTIFLLESGLLGLAGGVIGLLLGMGISKLVAYIGTQMLGSTLLKAYFPAWLVIGALLFAMLIGMASGALPAKQASSLQPVDALRYE